MKQKVEIGDRVTAHNVPGVRHGVVETIYPARLLIEPTEVAVRWNDGAWKVYDLERFVPMGWGTWELNR